MTMTPQSLHIVAQATWPKATAADDGVDTVAAHDLAS